MWGTPKQAWLPSGRLRYREGGSGEPVVFCHGVLTNGALWRRVAPALTDRYRCLVPDLPLGSHRAAMRSTADLSPSGLVDLLAEFFDERSVGSAVLVGNDLGGAICQLFAAAHPERVSRLALTNCETFGSLPPAPLGRLAAGARLPGVVYAVSRLLRLAAVRRRVAATLAAHPLPERILDAYFDPLAADPGVRRDFRKLLAGLDPAPLLAATDDLATFRRPVLLAWGGADRRLFPVEDAALLASLLPDARLEVLDGAKTLVPEDAPGELAGRLREFLAATAAATEV